MVGNYECPEANRSSHASREFRYAEAKLSGWKAALLAGRVERVDSLLLFLLPPQMLAN